MWSAGRPAANVLLRAVLLGAGAVSGYLLLSAFAGPAAADSGALGGALDPATDQVADAGGDLGGLLDDLPLPELASPQPEPAEPEPAEPPPAESRPEPAPPADDDPPEPAAQPDPEPATRPDPPAATEPDPQPPTRTDPSPVGDLVGSITTPRALTDQVTEVVAVTESALPVVDPLVETTGASLDQLATGLAGTVESTLAPITTTVDSSRPAAAPVIEDATATTTIPVLPSTGSLIDPIVAVLAPPAALLAVPATTTSLPDARDGPDPPGDPPSGPGRSPPPATSTATIATPDARAPTTAVAASANEREPPPRPARPPQPVPSTHQLAGQALDNGQPWPLPGPSEPATQPDPGRHRSFEDTAYAELVMPISAPPG